MKLDGIFKFAKQNVPGFCKKHLPEILTGVGIGLFGFTVVDAVRQTPEACMRIEERKLDLEVEKLPVIELVKTAGPCYIRPAMAGIASVGCIIGANRVNMKRSAALATAYALSETAFKEYKDKVVELLGDKKEEKVHEEVLQERLDKNPLSDNTIIVTGHGSTLCYDAFCGRYFYSDPEFIKSVMNEINRQLLFNYYVSLNDIYAKLGLDETEVGDMLGWGVGSGGLIEIYLSSKLTDGDSPCLVMEFVNHPGVDYNSMY